MVLLSQIRESPLALARLITQVENGTPAGQAALGELFSMAGQAHLVGVTGSPGAGKSSLVNRLARYFRHSTLNSQTQKPPRVAIVAVDPTSPFTGGAVLGDRVRMRDLAGDPGVFIRSMASRGALGGLAYATSAVVQVLDAAGFDLVLVETVGVGQAEVDIARLAHTTLVIEAPSMGDDIQAIKAGILEIADILVINKADLPGVDNTERALRGLIEMYHPANYVHPGPGGMSMTTPAMDHGKTEAWKPPLVRTICTASGAQNGPEGTGIAALARAIQSHREYLEQSGELQRRDALRLQTQFEHLLRDTLVERWRASLEGSTYLSALQAVLDRQLSPYQAVNLLLE